MPLALVIVIVIAALFIYRYLARQRQKRGHRQSNLMRSERTCGHCSAKIHGAALVCPRCLTKQTPVPAPLR